MGTHTRARVRTKALLFAIAPIFGLRTGHPTNRPETRKISYARRRGKAHTHETSRIKEKQTQEALQTYSHLSGARSSRKNWRVAGRRELRQLVRSHQTMTCSGGSINRCLFRQNETCPYSVRRVVRTLSATGCSR